MSLSCVHRLKFIQKGRAYALPYIIIYSILAVEPGFAGEIHAQTLESTLIYLG